MMLTFVHVILEKCASCYHHWHRCSAHMFSEWRVFHNFRTKNGIQVECSDSQLIAASDVGDNDILTNVLLVAQLKKTSYMREN